MDIAEITGLTPSSISQMERSVITPTIVTLKKIAAALEYPLAELIEGTEAVDGGAGRDDKNSAAEREVYSEPQIVHDEDRKVISPYKGVTYELLNPDFSGPFEFSYNIYKPGSGIGSEKRGHPGTECGVVMSGELLIRYGEQAREYRLSAGDSITFDSTIPHSVENPGTVDCICMWVNSPPWF
ncbi:MAG: cupin domain-containing protein [Planctomycetaceae bacterium]|nr:cupin domain-containing protein [Planctomycetaceae bacterium]